MISGLVWAYIVGGLTHATGRLHVLRIRGLADSDHGSIRNSKSRRRAQVPEVEFKREMDELNNLMDSSGLPQDLRAACRSASLEFLHEVKMRRYMHECIVAKKQLTQEP